jgi:hypothetical protein
MPLAIKPKHFEYIGWVGFILIVAAYFFLTIKLVDANAACYHIMNLIGALCMVANAKHNGAKPLFWLNVVWALVAIMGLFQLSTDSIY